MTREREQGGICLYRSLYCAFQGWLGTPLAEHQIFFLADGFQLRYQTMIKDGPLTQSVRFEDNVKVFALLAERLGITYYYHQGPIDTPQDISAALSRRCPVLLFTHVDALPYDQSGKLRSEAYHCIRILQPITTDLTYADDFVPDLRGGYSTRIHHMKFEKNQRHFIGYGYFDGGNSRQSVEYGVIFRENMKRFLAGGQMGEISLGATGLTRFLEDCQILREIEFSQKRYVDLMMILKYQVICCIRLLD